MPIMSAMSSYHHVIVVVFGRYTCTHTYPPRRLRSQPYGFSDGMACPTPRVWCSYTLNPQILPFADHHHVPGQKNVPRDYADVRTARRSWWRRAVRSPLPGNNFLKRAVQVHITFSQVPLAEGRSQISGGGFSNERL